MAEIWIFHGTGGKFASGAFSTLENAEAWIREHELTGVLTSYPLDIGVYEWTIQQGCWEPTKPHQHGPEFVGAFSSAHQDHRHYEMGREA